jgi:hypothetical protein
MEKKTIAQLSSESRLILADYERVSTFSLEEEQILKIKQDLKASFKEKLLLLEPLLIKEGFLNEGNHTYSEINEASWTHFKRNMNREYHENLIN